MISRRTVLRGVGTMVSLPLLEAMFGRSAFAAGPAAVGTGVAAGKVAPVRMAAFFTPNGMWMPDFTPKEIGAQWKLTPSLQSLEKVKHQVSVLSGLALDNAKAKGDGPGDHARSAAAFLTGAHPYKTAGADIRVGVSVDQVAAERVGQFTRLPSLEVGLDKTQTAGNCDSGYSCAYTSNISWRSANSPVPKEVDPGALFDRLFGSEDSRQNAEVRAKRLRYRKSILDLVAEDTKQLQRQLGKADQRKLDEFSTSLREIERRVQMARSAKADEPKPDYQRPDGIPGEMTEHMRLILDLVALAYQMDITRISTVMVARDGSNRPYPWLGITEGHHSISHHGRKKENIERIQKIDQYHIQQFAYFLEKLESIKEGEGTLLDNCMIMLGSGIGDGDRHNHDDLPVLFAGKGGGAVPAGMHLRYPQNTPLCNLYLSMLNHMGVRTDRFGDSTGPLKGMGSVQPLAEYRGPIL